MLISSVICSSIHLFIDSVMNELIHPSSRPHSAPPHGGGPGDVFTEDLLPSSGSSQVLSQHGPPAQQAGLRLLLLLHLLQHPRLPGLRPLPQLRALLLAGECLPTGEGGGGTLLPGECLPTGERRGVFTWPRGLHALGAHLYCVARQQHIPRKGRGEAR